MDYFRISFKPLLFTESSLCMNNASSGIFLKIHCCTETFPENQLSWEWNGSLFSGKGYYHRKTFQVSVLRQLSTADRVGNPSKAFSGEPCVRRWYFMGELHCRCLREGTRRPRRWVSKSSILLPLMLWTISSWKFLFFKFNFYFILGYRWFTMLC